MSVIKNHFLGHRQTWDVGSHAVCCVQVECDVGAPQVNYRESISRANDIRYQHKKQSGGSGQFAGEQQPGCVPVSICMCVVMKLAEGLAPFRQCWLRVGPPEALVRQCAFELSCVLQLAAHL
jgi:hypothetical protein